MIKKLFSSVFFLFIFSFNNHALAEEFTTEVIPLHNQSADDVLTTIRPLLPTGASATAFQGQLIVKTTAQNLQEIKTVLEKIDTPSAELMISVKQDGSGSESTSGYSVNGNINAGPNVTITHNSDGTVTESRGSHSTVNIINSRSTFSDNGTQQIRAMSGRPALINIGQQVPVVNTVKQYPYGTIQQSTEYKNVLQGFYVTAHLIGDDQVNLDLSTQNNKVGNNQRINVNEANTSLSGHLGEWITVGGTSTDDPSNKSGIIFSTNSARQQSHTIYIKVDRVN